MKLISQSEEIEDTIAIDGRELFDKGVCRIMAGPCAVESREQILFVAEKLADMGIKIFRAGAFKPRTNPYAFQGSQEQGLKWLEEVRYTYGMKIITETSDITNFDEVASVADIVQIGAKAMYDRSVLNAAGKLNKPVLMKRHFGATVDELFKMADYITLAGNRQIMFCERGIRTFETSSRFTLDLCGAAVIKRKTKAPLILDPSHSMGYSFGVPDVAKACAAFGCEGILIEVHHNPKEALCDREQALDLEEFAELYKTIKDIGKAVGKAVE